MRLLTPLTRRLGILITLALVGVLIFVGSNNSLAAVLGSLGIAAGLSLKDLLSAWIDGRWIRAERPFRIGDTVTVDPLHEGVVERIDLRTTHLRSTDGWRHIVPHSILFAAVFSVKEKS